MATGQLNEAIEEPYSTNSQPYYY